jgi:lipopolysaccharide/colanic/teichoic acid biosynthesis glycosyltransferase
MDDGALGRVDYSKSKTNLRDIAMEKTELTKNMRWKIAEYLAEDRLNEINRRADAVYVRDSLYTRYIKRLIDIIVSFCACIITLPLNLIIGVITYFDVGRPLFFRQERLGKNGKVFHIIKFRNMRDTKDERGELLPTAQRVTKFGKIVRKTSLDELLNFWSILKGDMSLIGPRPLVPEYYCRYSERHINRLAFRPGLECPPRGRLDHVWTWQEQFENDVWYVENVSFLTDCKMMLNLFRFALEQKSSNARAVSSRGTFMGYSSDGRAINMDEVPQEYIERVIMERDRTEEAVLTWKKNVKEEVGTRKKAV